LLRQLLRQLDTIPEDVLKEYSVYKRHDQMPPQETFERLLKHSIEAFVKATSSRVFVLVDAYDELLSTKEQRGDKAAAERAAVLTCLSQLVGIPDVKILITTRHQYREELRGALPISNVATIHGDHKDMEMYLQSRLKPLALPAPLKAVVLAELLMANEAEAW
jgi:hypothetical protein